MKLLSVLLLLAVALTAVAADSAGRWAPGTDGELLEELQLNSHHLVRQAMLSYVPPPRISEVAGRRALAPTPAGCAICKQLVATHILTSVLDQVKQACMDPKCPVIKARCEWIGEHPDEFTGYVVYKLRPMADGYFFCFGAGQCSHPPASTEGSESQSWHVDFTSNSTSDLVAQLSRSAGMVDRALAPSNETAPSSEPRPTWTEARVERLGSNDEQCHECLGKGVRWTMKRAVHALIKKCEETSCPYFKAWCDWAAQHKEFVRGEIYAKVQPYKYAIGWCAGKGECQCDAVATFPFTMKGRKHAEGKFEQLKHMLRD